jgi:hypothetical protein
MFAQYEKRRGKSARDVRTKRVASKFGMCELTDMDTQPRLTDFARDAGISKGYASDLLRGNVAASQAKAIEIYRRTGQKVRPIVDMTDEEIGQLEAILSKAA